jgi:CspA family cold shock protein
MATGTVKWFDPKKGFGFIINDEGQDVFTHFSAIEGEGFRALKPGEIVHYEMATGANGLYASKVQREKKKHAAQSPHASMKSAHANSAVGAV